MATGIPTAGQPQTVTVIQQPTSMVAAPGRPGGVMCDERFNGRTSIALGATQITIGILCIIFSIAARVLGAAWSGASAGSWCGSFFIVAGALGVSAGKRRTRSAIVGFMATSIIAAIMTMFLLGFSWAGAVKDRGDHLCLNFFFGTCYSYSEKTAKVAMNGVLATLAVVEAIIAIWASAVCCGVVCCGSTQNGQVMHTMHYVSAGQPMNVMYQQPQQNTYMQQQGGVAVHYPAPPSYMVAPPAYQPAATSVSSTPYAGGPVPYPANGDSGYPPSEPKQAFNENKEGY